MFCTYDNGVVRTFRGEYKDSTGTYPAAWLRKAIKDGRAPANVYFFTDNSRSGVDEFHAQGANVDNAPDANGEVIRTTTPVEKSVDVVKSLVKTKIGRARTNIAHSGIIFSSKNFATDSTTVESINLIATALLDGETSPGGTLPWDTLETPTSPKETFNATETQFKAFRNAVAKHFVLCTKAARTHLDAVDALTTFSEVTSYDYSTGWPANPDMSEPV